jgi:hypothetical protein
MNEQIKPFRTVEQIAKKHRLDVSFIENQLKMGEKIEHEHTKNHELAREIALQHLDEIPDYYTRLKKMETDAKKHHKKFKDVNVNEEGLRDWFGNSKSKGGKPGWVDVVDGDACAREKGETATPKCVSSRKRSSMSKEERLAAQAAKRREDPNQPQKSGAAEPTMVRTDRKTRTEEMDLQEVKDKPGKGSGKKDACYHKVKSRYDVWPSAYASGALVKCRKVGAANWGTKSEETMREEQRYCPLCNKREGRSECSYGEKAWDKVSVKDEEYSMVRSELETLMNAAQRLKAKVGKGEGNLEAWVQSKITKATDYIDTAADYVMSGEMEEQKIVDKVMDEMKCWPGYKKKGTQKLFGKKYNRCVKAEDVTIEDADGNTFAEVVDLIKPEPIKGFKSQVEEATRIQAQTGNIIAVIVSWRGKYYSLRMFFPQVKLPTRKEINDELQKVYPGSIVVSHSVSELQPGQPLIQTFGPQGGSPAKPGPSKSYVKTMGEEVEISEAKKSEMKCNNPKAEAHGSGETGKSHVVKACEGGEEKLIRFGQLGVKGSPKKKGESEEYASRRRKFKTRHAKNIAKGKMSAAFWSNKVKW